VGIRNIESAGGHVEDDVVFIPLQAPIVPPLEQAE